MKRHDFGCITTLIGLSLWVIIPLIIVKLCENPTANTIISAVMAIAFIILLWLIISVGAFGVFLIVASIANHIAKRLPGWFADEKGEIDKLQVGILAIAALWPLWLWSIQKILSLK